MKTLVVTLFSCVLIPFSLANADSTTTEKDTLALIEYKKNNLCIDLYYILIPYTNDYNKPGFGLSYERLIQRNKSIVVDIDYYVQTNESRTLLMEWHNYNIKAGFRFYLKKEYNKRKGRINTAGSGFYLSPVICYHGKASKGTKYDYLTHEVTYESDFDHKYSFEIGGSIGYQWIIKDIIILNIDIPYLRSIYHHNNNTGGSISSSDYAHTPISLNIGVSF